MLIGAALLAAISCGGRKKAANKADELVLNAHLSADEQWHTVYVAVSHTEYVSMVSSGELNCYVNGSLVARTRLCRNRLNSLQHPIYRRVLKQDALFCIQQI